MSKKKVAVCIGGYFNSFTDKRSKGVNGFEYIKEKILDKADADVFIHSWDLEHKDTMLELYAPWLKGSQFEKQINFYDVMVDRGLNERDLLLVDFIHGGMHGVRFLMERCLVAFPTA